MWRMGLTTAPHAPSAQELAIAKKLDQPDDPNFAKNMLQLAFAAGQANKFDEALQILQGLVIFRPTDAHVYSAFGIIYRMMRKIDEAILCFEHALTLTPDSLNVRVNLGELLWAQRRNLDVAREHLTLVAQSPGSALGQRALLILEEMGKTN